VLGFPEAYKHRIIFVTFILIIGILHYPLKYKDRESSIFKIIDAILILCVFLAGTYSAMHSEELYLKAGFATEFEVILCFIFILTILEVTRRAMGSPLPVLTVLFIIYSFFGQYFPEPLTHAGYDTFAFTDVQFLTLNGIFSIPIGASATYIVAFILFGSLFLKTGLADYMFNIAYALFGSRTAGPAKVAVISSGFIGSVSGSAAANVATTGAVTIPLMKRMGYPAETAGAIEATASSGGQFMPPIMGASAFIIAMYLGIPYLEVAAAAAIPAILYYLSVGTSVHILAKKFRLPTMKKEECPPVREALKKSYSFLPLIIVVVVLITGSTPMLAGFYAILAVCVIALLDKKLKFDFKTFVDGLYEGIINTLPVALACASAGIVVGVITLTGLGYMMSSILLGIAKNNLFLLLGLCMIAALILGMGMTTVGVYVLLAVLVAPALIKLGVTEIAAHFFPFYYGIISAITPPVAVASYTGAGIAKSDPFKTSIEALKIGLPAFIIPWFFAVFPGLVLQGPPINIFIASIITFAELTIITIAIHGWFKRDLNYFERMGLVILFLITYYFSMSMFVNLNLSQ
jgi:TRAP transporter 4TM/12TM fusion protein